MDVRRRYIFALLVISALILFFKLGERDLWEPDETRYAVIAREMRETGQWGLPRLNGTIYPEKPPLFFWMVNLSVFFLGENSELANRLPSALAGLITIFLTFFFGERLFSSRTGFLSGLILATCLCFPQLSRWMMLDSLITLLFLLTLFCFHLGYEKDEGRRRYYLLAGLFMGLGVLTKGPLAYLSLPIFLIFAFFQKELKKFWCYDLFLGFLVSLTVVLIWLIPACLMGGEDYTKLILFEQTVGRLSGNISHSHSKPFFFYFIRFPIEFIPWIVFLPTAFVLALQKDEAIKKKGLLFLSIWFLLIFILLTFSKGKKDNYLLPLYPAAALIVGWFWDVIIISRKREKTVIFGFLFLALLIVVPFTLFLFGFPQTLYPVLMPYHLFIVSILFYLFVGLSASLLFFVKGNKWASFICLVITFTVFHLHISYSLPQRLNAERSMKQLSERILERMEAGDELKLCFFCPAGLLYYTKKTLLEEIRSQDRFVEVFHSPQRVFMVITKAKLDRLKKELNMEVNILEQERIYWTVVLICNRSK
jgi:4-amino-4-deoxy-L-arabinose transferase-like glycosyltransferase